MKKGTLGGIGEIDQPSEDSNLLILFSCKVGDKRQAKLIEKESDFFYNSCKILRSMEDENCIDLLKGFQAIS